MRPLRHLPPLAAALVATGDGEVIRRLVAALFGRPVLHIAASCDREPAMPRLGEGPYGFIGFNRWADTAMAVLTPDDPSLPFTKENH